MALRLLALLPIPVVVLLVVHAGQHPLPPPPVLHGHADGEGKVAVKAVELPADLPHEWKVQGKPERYDEKTLFDRIDGAAPVYLRAGFVYSLGVDLRKPGMKESVVGDVYHMGTPLRALGMYATERDLSYSFIDVGDGGYLASGSLNFWRGPFYVKLAGYESGEAMDQALKELASGLAQALPAAPDLGALLGPLKLLPAEGRVPRSDGYSHPPLGEIEGLAEVFYASYKQGDETYRLFLAVGKDEAAAAQRYDQVKGSFKKDGAKVAETTEGAVRVLVAEGDTVTILLLRGARVAGGLDLPKGEIASAAKAKLLPALEQSLDGAKKAEARP